ncbi:hypothetical protein KKH81_00520 [Patescibacteria group bacterium]|nr:hypothetical protein [Patescibacteria group bacterium]
MSSSSISVISLASLFSSPEVLAILFTLIFIVWVIYSIIAGYHWVRYGYDSWMSTPAIAVHLFISGVLMIYAVSGFK